MKNSQAMNHTNSSILKKGVNVHKFSTDCCNREKKVLIMGVI